MAIRAACGYDNEQYGTGLVGQAFNSTHGPLRDRKATKSERDATVNLFLGATGLFKNPGSHRYVEHFDDANAAAELICFASALMRIVIRAAASKDDEA